MSIFALRLLSLLLLDRLGLLKGLIDRVGVNGMVVVRVDPPSRIDRPFPGSEVGDNIGVVDVDDRMGEGETGVFGDDWVELGADCVVAPANDSAGVEVALMDARKMSASVQVS